MAHGFRLLGGVLTLTLCQPFPARAETLNLVCENERGASLEYLIDLDRKTVQYATPSECIWNLQGRQLHVPDCAPPGRAEVSERSITWESIEKTVNGAGGIGSRTLRGSLNRLTGAVWLQQNTQVLFEGKCRRATKKLF